MERNPAERGIPNRGGPRRLAACYREGPGATRAVNKTAKEGEQCARLPLSWGGRRCELRSFALARIIRHSEMPVTLARGCPPSSAYRRAAPLPAPGHGKISPRCVPVLPAVARLHPDAFKKGPRTGKTPVRGNISPACIQIQLILARYAWHVSEKPRRAPLGNTPREHLAAKGRFRRPKPSDHARRTNPAIL